MNGIGAYPYFVGPLKTCGPIGGVLRARSIRARAIVSIPGSTQFGGVFDHAKEIEMNRSGGRTIRLAPMTMTPTPTLIRCCRAFHRSAKIEQSGPVAQLVRASVLHTEGPQFEPVRGHHFSERIQNQTRGLKSSSAVRARDCPPPQTPSGGCFESAPRVSSGASRANYFLTAPASPCRRICVTAHRHSPAWHRWE